MGGVLCSPGLITGRKNWQIDDQPLLATFDPCLVGVCCVSPPGPSPLVRGTLRAPCASPHHPPLPRRPSASLTGQHTFSLPFPSPWEAPTPAAPEDPSPISSLYSNLCLRGCFRGFQIRMNFKPCQSFFFFSKIMFYFYLIMREIECLLFMLLAKYLAFLCSQPVLVLCSCIYWAVCLFHIDL